MNFASAIWSCTPMVKCKIPIVLMCQYQMTTLPGFANVASVIILPGFRRPVADHRSRVHLSLLGDRSHRWRSRLLEFVARWLKFSVAQRESWQHKQVQRHRAQQAAEDTDRHATLDLASGIAHADCKRQHAEAGDDRGHENRTKPIRGSSDCSIQPPGHVLNFDEMLVVGDHENRITECDAEESDE